jgi:DNA-directed RNA polymerase specialized sigma subunit
VAKIVDLQEEINRKIDNYVDLKREISAVLEQMDDPDQVKVLHKRYFEYKPWERIACEMSYSFRNVCYIHGKALQAVDAILEGKGEKDG